MDLRRVNYFVEVIKEKSFSRAAQKLFISQPMLSKAIQQMEDELGTQLILRSSKQFQITEAGRQVYQQCVKILNDCYELEHLLDDSYRLIRGTVSISIPLATAKAFFLPVFIHLQEKFPEIHIELFEEGAYAVADSLLRDIVDIGVVMLPIPTHGLDVYEIVDDKCVLVVSASHPLASREWVGIEELTSEKFILFNRSFILREIICQACYAKMFSPEIIFQCSHNEIILKLVEANQGITILPAPTCPDNAPGLRKIPLIPEIPWKQALAVKKDKYFSPAALQVISEILSYFVAAGMDGIVQE